MSYDQACHATYLYTGTSPSDWNAVGIKGFREVEGGAKGQSVSMPEFDFPSGYSHIETPFDSEGSCGLCGHNIKHTYWIQNDSTKQTMGIGSECVTKFGEGKSGTKLAKEAKHQQNRDFLSQAWGARQSLIDKFGSIYERPSPGKPTEKIPAFTWKLDNKWSISDLARHHGISEDNAKKAIEAYHQLDAMLRTSKGYPIMHEPQRLAQFQRDSRGTWQNTPSYTRFSDVANNATISRWEKKRGDDIRQLIDTVDELLGTTEQPEKHSLKHIHDFAKTAFLSYYTGGEREDYAVGKLPETASRTKCEPQSLPLREENNGT